MMEEPDGCNRQHYIQQTIVGPICTHPGCNCKVNQNKTLFSCTANTIAAHWKKKGCSHGTPSPKKVERQLDERLRQLHIQSVNNKEAAFLHFKEGDDGVKRRKRCYCSHCGLVDRKHNLEKEHCGARCTGRPIQGLVFSNKYNQLVPEAILLAIVNGNSPLPILKPKLYL